MSKRITLTDFEVEQIVAGLQELQKQPAINYQVVQCGREFYQIIIDKLQPKLKDSDE